MNRRDFTASLAALAATPAIPFAHAIPAAAATPAVPAGAYAWAQLIARAQDKCSPAMLARHLNLSADVAMTLFNDMLRDGVLRAPGITGVARATAPISTSGTQTTLGNRIVARTKQVFDTPIPPEDCKDEATPLVNAHEAGLGCTETAPKDEINAGTDQSPEESAERG